MFKDNADKIWDLNEEMCKTFKKIEGGKVETLPQFRKLVKNKEFLNQISRYVKVE